MDDLISRQAAINALRKALFKYEDETEKKFLESPDLDIYDWAKHRIFVQNMNDIDVKTILNLPSSEPEKGKWIYKADGKYHCNKCDCIAPYYSFRWNFCPNCGAEMEKLKE